jgi:hypothetical protein
MRETRADRGIGWLNSAPSDAIAGTGAIEVIMSFEVRMQHQAALKQLDLGRNLGIPQG